jgi:tRNA A-37 threonylcarbamoyl transferase component Bud32
VLAAIAAVLAPGPGARAEGTATLGTAMLTAVVADLAPAEPDLAEEAAAVNLLLQSMLKEDQRHFTPRSDLATNLAELPGQTAEVRTHLSVDRANAPRLMEKMLVDRLFMGTISREPGRLVVTAEVMGPKGAPLAVIRAMAPEGDIADLAAQVARQAAGPIECILNDLSIKHLSMRQMQPFAAASIALNGSDFEGAARALELATPGAAKALSAIEEMGRVLIANQSLESGDRLKVALAVGNATAARTFAEKALKSEARSVTARAGKVRALILLNELALAAREAEQLPADDDSAASAVARAQLIMARNGSASGRDEAMAPMVNKPAATWKPALAFMAGTRPNTFGPDVEEAALDAAAKLAKESPALATAIAFRGLQGEGEHKRAVPLLRLRDLSSDDSVTVKPQLGALAAEGFTPAVQLTEAMARRDEIAQSIRLELAGAPETGVSVTLVNALAPLLESFPHLAERKLTNISLVPMEMSGPSVVWPYKARPQLLQVGLVAALTGPPYSLVATPPAPDQEPIREGQMTDPGFANLAHKLATDALMLFKVTTKGSDAEVTLILWDASRQKGWTKTAVLKGAATGLTGFNPIPVIALGLLAAVALALAIRKMLSGSVVVVIKEDADAKDPILCLKVARTSQNPGVGNSTTFGERLRGASPTQTRTGATHVKARTKFASLTRGKWYVHLYGTYKRGTDVQVLSGEEFTREVEIQAGRAATVHFNMEPTHAQFVVHITDNEVPVAAAKVWLDDVAKVHRTGRDGKVILDIPRGKHVITIEANGNRVEKSFDVLQTKIHELHVNLEWERRRDDVSRSLERDSSSVVRNPFEAPGVRRAIDLPAEDSQVGPSSLIAPSPMAGVLTPVQGVNPHLSVPPSFAPAMAGRARREPIAVPAFAPSHDLVAMPPAMQRPPGEHMRGARQGVSSAVGMAIEPRLSRTNSGEPEGANDAAIGAAISIGNVMAMPEPAPLTPGPAAGAGLSRYQKTAQLGAGAMGVVYRAFDTVLDREVALKIMSPDIRDNPAIAEKFRIEAKALAALNHPNIVTVFDQGQDQGELFMVMELVEGGTLDDILKKKEKLAIEEAVDLIDQLCAGMAYAHKRRIIHRDIKPANIFVTNEHVVKIGDFGLARALAAVKITKTMVQGTPLYMSPEQILGRDVDTRADIYSIGCTFFELLTGRPPFIEGEVLYHHMHTPPPRVSEFAPGLPSAVDSLINGCLAKDKKDRIPNAESIRESLKAVRAILR